MTDEEQLGMSDDLNAHMSDRGIQQNRDLLDSILDQLIPANPEKGIPSAGVFGVGDFIVTRADNDVVVAAAIQELLSSATALDGKVNVEAVRQLEKDHAMSFSVLVQLTYMGYYSRPEIRSLVGLGSWPVHPKGYEVPIESPDMLKKLTDPVSRRGKVYREPGDVPERSAHE